MKKRSPLFVAGFPYTSLFIGYFVFFGMLNFSSNPDSNKLSDSEIIAIIGALAIIIIGAGYTIYWCIETARKLRKLTGESIPPAILLVLPIVSYWWFWRYSMAAEKYTKGKVQGILAFILLALLGAIGMGILQDAYNKIPSSEKPA